MWKVYIWTDKTNNKAHNRWAKTQIYQIGRNIKTWVCIQNIFISILCFIKNYLSMVASSFLNQHNWSLFWNKKKTPKHMKCYYMYNVIITNNNIVINKINIFKGRIKSQLSKGLIVLTTHRKSLLLGCICKGLLTIPTFNPPSPHPRYFVIFFLSYVSFVSPSSL